MKLKVLTFPVKLLHSTFFFKFSSPPTSLFLSHTIFSLSPPDLNSSYIVKISPPPCLLLCQQQIPLFKSTLYTAWLVHLPALRLLQNLHTQFIGSGMMLNRELLDLLVAVLISLPLLDFFLGHWITETHWGKDPSWLHLKASGHQHEQNLNRAHCASCSLAHYIFLPLSQLWRFYCH